MRIEELARPHPKFAKMYRDGKKGMLILLSNNCLVLPAVVKQEGNGPIDLRREGL